MKKKGVLLTRTGGGTTVAETATTKKLRWREGSRVARALQGSHDLFAHRICLANALDETL